MSRLQGGERVLLGVAGEGEDLAVVLGDGTMAQGIGDDMVPGPRGRARDDQLLAVRRIAVGQGVIVGRPQAAVERPCLIEDRGQLGGIGFRLVQVAGNRGGGHGLVGGVAVNQAQLGGAVCRQLDS